MNKNDHSVFSYVLFIAGAIIILLFIAWLIIPRLAVNTIYKKSDISLIDKLIEKSEVEKTEAIVIIESINYKDFEIALISANDTLLAMHERKSIFIEKLIDHQDIQEKISRQLSDDQFIKMLDKINTNSKLIPVLFPSFKNLLIKQVENYYKHEDTIE